MPPAPFTLPAEPAASVPGGVLASLKEMWAANGWDPDSLHAFRMGPDDDDTDDDDDAGDDDSDDDGDDDSNDDEEADFDEKVKEVLAKERRLTRSATKALKPWKKLAREFNVTPDQVREALAKKPSKGKDDDDKPDAEAIRREAEATARRSADRRVIGAEVRRLAGGLFKDARDAVRYLDLDEYEVDADGDVDEDEILADLQELLRKKPHLKKRARKPKPDPAQSKKTEKGKGLGGAGAAEAARRFGDKKQQ